MSEREVDVIAVAVQNTAVESNRIDALTALDALSVRLAQAEQERDEARADLDEHIRVAYQRGQLEAEARLRVTDALKREYEEALKQIARFGNRGKWHNDIARAVLASGGREALAEGDVPRRTPDTKEPEEQ